MLGIEPVTHLSCPLSPSPLPPFRDIPYLSKHRADRMKRLGDFLNLESFDLALLEEVRLYGRLGWRRAAGGAGGLFGLG